MYSEKSIPKFDIKLPGHQVEEAFEDVTLTPFNGNIKRDSLKLKLESVDYVYKIPTIDNMVAGMLLTRVGVVQQEVIDLS